jgi:hypothetical protein
MITVRTRKKFWQKYGGQKYGTFEASGPAQLIGTAETGNREREWEGGYDDTIYPSTRQEHGFTEVFLKATRQVTRQ